MLFHISPYLPGIRGIGVLFVPQRYAERSRAQNVGVPERMVFRTRQNNGTQNIARVC